MPVPNAYTLQEEIADTRVSRPHVVILGAGASRQAFPGGDANGRTLPVMADLLDTLGLAGDVRAARLHCPPADFEGLYSEIVERADLRDLQRLVEDRVDEYFGALEMPAHATLYDRLVCSLRPKDVIATFNWDPFLFDAMRRNAPFRALPKVRFLHGCVRLGACSCGALGGRDDACHRCGRPRERLPLLYPVARKDYASRPVISSFWKLLRDDLRNAYILTIFGYGAPRTDAEAVRLLREAWGRPADRRYEEIEIVDIRDREDLAKIWAGFIHSHHYRVYKSFEETLIARHPRRSCEVLFSQLMDIRWVMHTDPLPVGVPIDKIHEQLAPRLSAEGEEDYRRDE